MRIDLYTRIVLTVIAGCLLWLCAILTPTSTVLSAQTTIPVGQTTAPGPQEVIIVGVKHPGFKPRAGSFEAPRLNGSWDPLAAFNTQAPAPPR